MAEEITATAAAEPPVRKEFKVKITEHIGELSKNDKNWTKELNLVSWSGNAPKYDIRLWSPDKKKLSKGITLTEDEVKRLVKCVVKKFQDEAAQQEKIADEIQDKIQQSNIDDDED